MLIFIINTQSRCIYLFLVRMHVPWHEWLMLKCPPRRWRRGRRVNKSSVWFLLVRGMNIWFWKPTHSISSTQHLIQDSLLKSIVSYFHKLLDCKAMDSCNAALCWSMMLFFSVRVWMFLCFFHDSLSDYKKDTKLDMKVQFCWVAWAEDIA